VDGTTLPQPLDKRAGGCKGRLLGVDNDVVIVADDNDAALVVEDNDVAMVAEPLLCRALDVRVVHCSLFFLVVDARRC